MNRRIEPDILESIKDENLSIEVTTRCTSACTHCFARAGRQKPVDLDFDTARAVIDEGSELGYRRLHLTGGEPFLWEHTFGLLEYAAAAGYESSFINTNAMVLDRETAKKLAGTAGPSLSVSVQGPEEVHDRFRGKGSFKKALAGLENALAAGIKTSVFTVTGRGLLPSLPRFADFLNREYPGIEALTLIQLIRVHGDAFDLSDELLAPGDFLTMVRAAALLNLFGYRVSILQNPLATVASRAMEMPWLAPAPPLYRPGGLIVMADGAVTPAHSSRDDLGAYKPGALGEILASKLYGELTGTDNNRCEGCRHLPLCRENGMVRPSEPFRDMDEEKPYCVRVLDRIE